MEAAEVGGQAGQGDVIDGEIEAVGADGAFVGHGEAGGLRERHLEIGIERLDGRDGKQRRLVDEILAQAEAEKIADGDLDRRRRFAIPPGPENQILEVHGVGRVDGEPEVGDDAGAADIEQGGRFARIDGHGIAVAAAAVPTGRAAGLVVAQAGQGEQFLRRVGLRHRGSPVRWVCGGSDMGRGVCSYQSEHGNSGNRSHSAQQLAASRQTFIVIVGIHLEGPSRRASGESVL